VFWRELRVLCSVGLGIFFVFGGGDSATTQDIPMVSAPFMPRKRMLKQVRQLQEVSA